MKLSKENLINEHKGKDKSNKNIKKDFKISGLNITKKIEILDDSIQNNYRKTKDISYLLKNYIPIFFYFFTFSNIEAILATRVAFVFVLIKTSALAL